MGGNDSQLCLSSSTCTLDALGQVLPIKALQWLPCQQEWVFMFLCDVFWGSFSVDVFSYDVLAVYLNHLKHRNC